MVNLLVIQNPDGGQLSQPAFHQPISVFLSVGQASTEEHEIFINAVEDFLRSHALIPRTVGRREFSIDNKPLKRIHTVLGECSGTIVVALERLRVDRATEFPAGSHSIPLIGIKLPTVWNQIEAAMAYSLGHPLLGIVEQGLRPEGLLESGYDWYIEWLDLNPSSLSEPSFLATFEIWKLKVEEFHRSKRA